MRNYSLEELNVWRSEMDRSVSFCPIRGITASKGYGQIGKSSDEKRRDYTMFEKCSLWDEGALLSLKKKTEGRYEKHLQICREGRSFCVPFGKGFAYKTPALFQVRFILDVKICVSAMRHWNRLLSSTVDSLSLEHLEKCLSMKTAAGSALPETEKLWLPPSQGFWRLLGYHCVFSELVNICIVLVYMQNANKSSKMIFASLRLFVNVHYLIWIDLVCFAYCALDLRFVNCRCKEFQGEWWWFFNSVQRNVHIRYYFD